MPTNPLPFTAIAFLITIGLPVMVVVAQMLRWSLS